VDSCGISCTILCGFTIFLAKLAMAPFIAYVVEELALIGVLTTCWMT